ncbi:uncharacterized protein BDR25DRAFT_302732 [Lindgomyces ingoldianus]|uniref:Uncharacterized protein n=1 Tax=Lindgomyces ingoldianus TaxID=673940 RepID=A0ACB6R0J9_9PLEO|nr:uncharacterized protein BDR25DRAFT_302732 [Lindgomyces ingoldianus]KAF2472620.1 hypothetical protein BDR25DRAFT_302732 [Lindgomyces ingoldianus]
MSGCEILGAVAAAMQLICIATTIGQSIIDFPEKLSQLSNRIRCSIEQLQLLRNALQDIKKNRQLHTRFFSIQVQTISTKVTTLNNLLEDTYSKLKRPRVKRLVFILTIKKVEKLINENFAALESDKSNLSLYIMSSCREALTSLQNPAESPIVVRDRMQKVETPEDITMKDGIMESSAPCRCFFNHTEHPASIIMSKKQILSTEEEMKFQRSIPNSGQNTSSTPHINGGNEKKESGIRSSVSRNVIRNSRNVLIGGTNGHNVDADENEVTDTDRVLLGTFDSNTTTTFAASTSPDQMDWTSSC